MATTIAELQDHILEFVRHFEDLNEGGLIVRIAADIPEEADYVGFQFTIKTIEEKDYEAIVDSEG